ncbi:MAG TPA: hypothetical protein VFH88_08295 [Candidatus Krumholzibacteria bacterium]|nr:hypothetical protein [Candidatus Krumholzibacteria bacterium]
MKKPFVPAAALLAAVLLAASVAVAQTGTPAAATTAAKDTPISKEEITRQVPALNNLHELVYQLWHEAYPAKDYAAIKQLLPQADELTAKLDAAALPGILRDSQADWDAGKVKLKDSLAALHKAADANDEAAMLTETEAYHGAFEGLVRVVRPVVPELDAFHQELYKLYHYHMPDYDLDAIRADATAMQEKLPPLSKATLPERLAGRQKDFDAAVAVLSSRVDELVKIAKKDNREDINTAVENVHMAYVKTEKVFE